MKILIIGGSGFIGRRLVGALKGHELRLFTRGCGDGRTPVIRGTREDLLAYRATFAANPPDVVIDTGAQNYHTAALALKAFENLTQHFVVLSSLSVYRRYGWFLGAEPGGEAEVYPLEEAAPLRTQLFVYRRSDGQSTDPSRPWLADYDKILAERAYCSRALGSVTIMRLPLIYGPEDPDRRVQSLVERIRRAPVKMHKDMAAWRNARSYVGNVTDAIACVTLRADVTSGIRVYNVADSPEMNEATWLHKIAMAAGLTDSIDLITDKCDNPPAPVSDFPVTADYRYHLSLSTTRIRKELGWSPQTGVEDALAETVRGMFL